MSCNNFSLAELRAMTRENGDCDCFEHNGKLRSEVEKQAQPWCLFCDLPRYADGDSLQWHHVAYKNQGHELSKEGIVVCDYCHGLAEYGKEINGIAISSNSTGPDFYTFFDETAPRKLYVMWTVWLMQGAITILRGEDFGWRFLEKMVAKFGCKDEESFLAWEPLQWILYQKYPEFE